MPLFFKVILKTNEKQKQNFTDFRTEPQQTAMYAWNIDNSSIYQ